MRLVTRSDFDGLACGALLDHLGLIDEYKFAHPKDLQDGLVAISKNDVLANVPFVPGCGMWFDHHTSEHQRLERLPYNGLSKIAPSCARVIWEYYGGHERIDPKFDELLEAVDRVDSGNLSKEEIDNPQGWVLLGFIMDPRTGLGRYKDYTISNYQLMLDMISYCSSKTTDEILVVPDVQERVKRYYEQDKVFRDMIKRTAKEHGKTVVVDLREEQEIYTGNRFVLYTMFPESNISVQIMWGLKQQNVVYTVGYSITNRTCTLDVGALMLSLGGGGHEKVGTCQVSVEAADDTLEIIMNAITAAEA